jgi:hypothetical protein
MTFFPRHGFRSQPTKAEEWKNRPEIPHLENETRINTQNRRNPYRILGTAPILTRDGNSMVLGLLKVKNHLGSGAVSNSLALHGCANSVKSGNGKQEAVKPLPQHTRKGSGSY